MADFVRDQRLQFLRIDQGKRRFRDEDDCSTMNPDHCLRHVDYLDLVHGRPLGGPQQPGQGHELLARDGVQVGDRAFWWKARQDASLVVG